MKEIIKTKWVWNEQTQEHEAVEYHTGKYKLDESDKIAIVSEYMQGQMSASQIIEKYGIKSRQTLFSWMDKYVNEKELVSLQDETNPSDPMAKKSPEDRVKELEAENKKLQKALELEKLRSKALDTMITVAEETFNIPVRKKAGTKQ
jgi:transposase-like protein